MTSLSVSQAQAWNVATATALGEQLTFPSCLFAFTIRDMAPHPASAPRYTSGTWLPPRPLQHNVSTAGIEDPPYHNTTSYAYDTSRNSLVDLQTPNPSGIIRDLEPYKCVSMYYDHGKIWIVNYDATAYAVGNGRLANDEGAGSSEAGGAHQEDDDIRYDWQELQFRHIPDGSSWVDYAMGQPTLQAKRSDQTWQRRILPDAYIPPQTAHRRASPYGALRGNLAILLGLVATAAHPEGTTVHYSLYHVVHRTWQSPQQANPLGWFQRRGLVVTVYVTPQMAAAVEHYEQEALFD